MKKTIPLYEKRKRCDILLEPIIREWVSVEQTEERKPLSILREDCLSLDKDACDSHSTCSWSGGRCLIHVPTRGEAVDPVRIYTARLSDELLRYPSSKREIFEQKVQAIRVPRGAVRVGDELYLATKAKESAEAVLERLGFFGQMAAQFPEEMLRFEGLEDEGEGPSIVEDDLGLEMESEPASAPLLPPAWIEKGLTLVEGDTKQESLTQGTAATIDNWETRIKKKRATASLPGDPNRPITWSIQDWYSVVRIVSSDLLFVTRNPAGLLKVSLWIKYNTGGLAGSSMYMIFWDNSLVVRGTTYRFFQKDIPNDLITALDAVSPIPDEEAKNGVEAPVPQLVGAKSEAKSKAKSEKPVLESAAKPVLGSESGPSTNSSSGTNSSSESDPSPESITPKEAEASEKPDEKPGPGKPEEPTEPEEPKEGIAGVLSSIVSAITSEATA
jgi:hypothetical protein